MKRTTILLFLTLTASLSFSQSGFRIDHTSATLFEKIPTEYVSKAAALRLMYRHASVGTTIDGGLNCLQGTKNRCSEYPQYQFDRRNWVFQIRPNSGWFGKINDFATEVRRQIDSFDVFAFKYCYLDGLDMVAEPCGTPLKQANVTKAWETLRDTMLALESTFPEKKFIWWTIPLTQVGQHCTDELNALIRTYCQTQGKILFDLAAIESHDTLANHITTSEGWEMAFKPYCGEQKPDAQACHPNDLGGSLIAKAVWVLMAQLAGWEPVAQSVFEIESIRYPISVSPNPAIQYIDLTLTEPTITEHVNHEDIQIFNSQGIRVYYPAAVLTTADGLRIYVSTFPAGMYSITKGQATGKFIKQ